MTTPTTLTWPFKDPNETVDREIEWTQRMPASDSVVTAVWSVPFPLVQADQAVIEEGKVTSIFLSGGTLGETYEVTCTATTAQGRVLEQSVKIKVKKR